MKVKELIKKLEALNPELNILCYSEEDNKISLMEIDHVSESNCKVSRAEDGSLQALFERGPDSVKVAFLNLIHD